MLRKHIKRFIKRAAGFDIPFVYFYDNKPNAFPICMILSNCGQFVFYMISINRHWLNAYRQDPVLLKAGILHEVGHFKTKAHLIKQESVREYKAQVWAINRAKRMGMKKISNRLRAVLIGWFDDDWNSRRKYVMAAKIAKKNKII